MKRFLSILCVSVLLTGCGNKETAEPAAAVEETVQEETEQTEAAGDEMQETEKAEVNFSDLFTVEAEGIDYLSVEGIEVPEETLLTMIGKDSKSNFWKKVREGAEQAVADLNAALGYSGSGKVEFLYDAPEHEDVAEQIDIIDQILDKNPDALCIGFVDMGSGRTQLDLAKANGIPVLAVDSGLENSQIAVTIQTDNYEAGKQSAKELCEAIGDSGKIALLVHNSQTESGTERERGFLEEIKHFHPEVEVVDVSYRQQDERSVDEIVAAVLQEHPDLKAYFGTNDVVSKELLSALDLCADENMNILAAGFDASSKEIEAVVQNRMAGVMAQNPYAMGYASAVAALREIAGLKNAGEVLVDHYWIGLHNLEEEQAQQLIYK